MMVSFRKSSIRWPLKSNKKMISQLTLFDVWPPTLKILRRIKYWRASKQSMKKKKEELISLICSPDSPDLIILSLFLMHIENNSKRIREKVWRVQECHHSSFSTVLAEEGWGAHNHASESRNIWLPTQVQLHMDQSQLPYAQDTWTWQRILSLHNDGIF